MGWGVSSARTNYASPAHCMPASDRTPTLPSVTPTSDGIFNALMFDCVFFLVVVVVFVCFFLLPWSAYCSFLPQI